MKWIFGLFIISTIILSGCASNNNTVTPGQFDSLAQCMTAADATMYGTEWCPHCQNQKELFGSSFKYIDYVDCDKYQNDCIAAGVKGYPTWKINNELYPGTQNLYLLASKSGCQDQLTAAG